MTITCSSYRGYPEAEVLWRDGQGTLLTGNVTTSQMANEQGLFDVHSVLRVMLGVNGTYSCLVRNPVLQQDAHGSVTITGEGLVISWARMEGAATFFSTPHWSFNSFGWGRRIFKSLAWHSSHLKVSPRRSPKGFALMNGKESVIMKFSGWCEAIAEARAPSDCSESRASPGGQWLS